MLHCARNFFLIGLLFIAAPGPGQSQDTGGEPEEEPAESVVPPASGLEFALEFSGGLSFASMTGKAVENTETGLAHSAESRLTGNMGMAFHYFILPNLFLSAGIGYISKGYKILMASASSEDFYSQAPTSVSAKLYQSTEVGFWEVPVLVTAGTRNRRMFLNPFCFFGVSFGFVKTAEIKYFEETTETDMANHEEVDKENLATVDLMEDAMIRDDSTGASFRYSYDNFYSRRSISLVMGAGFERLFSRAGLYGGVQYWRSLTTFDRLSDQGKKDLAGYLGPGADVSQDADSYFRNISLVAGLRLYF